MDGKEMEAGQWVLADGLHVDPDEVPGGAVGTGDVQFESGSSYGGSDSEDSVTQFYGTSTGVHTRGVDGLTESVEISAAALGGVHMLPRRPRPMDAAALRLPDSHPQVVQAGAGAGASGGGAGQGRTEEPEVDIDDSKASAENERVDLLSTVTADSLLEALRPTIDNPLDTPENRRLSHNAAQLAHNLLEEQKRRYHFVQIAANKVLERQRRQYRSDERHSRSLLVQEAAAPFTLPADSNLERTLQHVTASLRKLRVLQRKQSSLLHQVYEFERSQRVGVTTAGPTIPPFVPLDGPLGPIGAWDAVLVLHQWEQPPPSKVPFQAIRRLATCRTKWRNELAAWVSVSETVQSDSTSAGLRPGLPAETEAFVKYLDSLGRNAMTVQEVAVLERQCRLFVLRWRLESAYLTFDAEVVKQYHPLRVSGDTNLSKKSILAARKELYPGGGGATGGRKAGGARAQQGKGSGANKAGGKKGGKTERVSPEFAGPGAGWLNDTCSEENLVQYIARDLRVRMLLVAWSLELLNGKHYVRYQVRRVAAAPVPGHVSKVGDLLFLVKATEFGLAQMAVDCGYSLQAVDEVNKDNKQPQLPFLEIEEARRWTREWLHRDTIKEAEPTSTADVNSINEEDRRVLTWEQPHEGPFAPYSRALVYHGLWRRFRLPNVEWSKDGVSELVSSSDTVVIRLLTVQKNLKRRTPASLFTPADRSRLFFRMLRTTMWVDGDAPSVSERLPARIRPGNVIRKADRGDASSDYLGPDLVLCHHAEALSSLESLWDTVKDQSFQSILQNDPTAEREFIMGLRSYHGEQVAIQWALYKATFIYLGKAAFFTMFLRYLVLEVVLQIGNTPDSSVNRLGNLNDGQDVETSVNLGWGAFFLLWFSAMLLRKWKRLRAELAVWWGLPTMLTPGSLSVATVEQFVVRQSWKTMLRWYHTSSAVMLRWLWVVLLLCGQGAAFYFIGDAAAKEFNEPLADSRVNTVRWQVVVIHGFSMAFVNLIGRWLYANVLSSKKTGNRTKAARTHRRSKAALLASGADYEPFGGICGAGRDWRQQGAPALSPDSIYSQEPMARAHHALKGRRVMYSLADEQLDLGRWLFYHCASHFLPLLWLAVLEGPVNCARLCFEGDCFRSASFLALILNWMLVIFTVIGAVSRNRWRTPSFCTLAAPWKSVLSLRTAKWFRGLEKWEEALNLKLAEPDHTAGQEDKEEDNSADPELGDPDYLEASKGDGAGPQLNAAFKANRNTKRRLAAVGATIQVVGLTNTMRPLGKVAASSVPGLKGGSGRGKPARRRNGSRNRARRGGTEGKARPSAGSPPTGAATAPAKGQSKSGDDDATAAAASDASLSSVPREAREAHPVLPLDVREPYEDIVFFANVLFVIATAAFTAPLDPTFAVGGTVYLLYVEDSYLARLLLSSSRLYPHRLRMDRWTSYLRSTFVAVSMLYSALLTTAVDAINLLPRRCYLPNAPLHVVQHFSGWQVVDFVLFIFSVGLGIAFVVLMVLPNVMPSKSVEAMKKLANRNAEAVTKMFAIAQRTTLLNHEFQKEGSLRQQSQAASAGAGASGGGGGGGPGAGAPAGGS